MGNAGSVDCSAGDLAIEVNKIGGAFNGYADAIVANGIDGQTLMAVTEVEMIDFFEDVGVKVLHQKRLLSEFYDFQKLGGGVPRMASSYKVPKQGREGKKLFRGFLSHFKTECGTEARLIQTELKRILPHDDIFLDSDDLNDLRLLLHHVKDTETLIFLQTKNALTRPWVILELYTAITSGIPIVALNVRNANPYDYGEAASFLEHFDQEIEIINPGAAEVLLDQGLDPVDVAYRLSVTIPNIISTEFNPHASSKVIRASLEDLVDSMGKADPMAPCVSKEEWLASRMRRRASVSTLQQHGSGMAVDPSNKTSRVLADIPSTVPELPNGYLVRDSDLFQLKAALQLKNSDTNTAALTSKTRKQTKKVSAHGMGGVGKTTIAAALVQDEKILTSFQKVVWVSVGQEPDLFQLQNSIHFQLTQRNLSEGMKQEYEVFEALRTAARGCVVLLVLDDIWEQKHEKLLNCVDVQNDSRLLVTTRMRGLLKHSAEVDVGILSQHDALQLLLSAAGMAGTDMDMDMDTDTGAGVVKEGAEAAADDSDSSDERRIALEMVELCGRLPLTLAIAGGIVAEQQGFSEDILEVMREDHLRGERNDFDGDDHGRTGGERVSQTLEERVISSSVKVIRCKNKELVLRIFRFFAVFPEDVPVPAAFFNKMSSLLTDDKHRKKARLAVGSGLSTLLKYNLIKGTLSSRTGGVLMHDIVRNYVISQHSRLELHALQQRVVDAILEARPEATGFLPSTSSPPGSFERYVAEQLYWHVRGAVAHGEAPPDAWLAHTDNVIVANTAIGVGEAALTSLSQQCENAGELVRAARASWAASMAQGVDQSKVNDVVFRAAELLERADDPEAAAFEGKVLSVAFICDVGSARHTRSGKRSKLLGSSAVSAATFDSKAAEALASWTDAWTKLGVFGKEPEAGDVEEALQSVRIHNCLYIEAGKLIGSSPSYSMFCKNMMHSHGLGLMLLTSQFAQWNPAENGCSEEGMVDGIEFYRHDVCGPAMKAVGMKIDYFCLWGGVAVLALFYGNLVATDAYLQKVLLAYKQIDLPSSKCYKEEAVMLYHLPWVTFSLYVLLDEPSKVLPVLQAIGFTWDKKGFENFDLYWASIKDALPTLDRQCESTAMRLLIFLASPPSGDSAIDAAEVSAWLPSPKDIAEMERGNTWVRRYVLYDLTGMAARAFLRLGRDDDAVAMARLAVSPEQRTEKKWTLVTCHSILGQIAAKRGQGGAAEEHFARAVREARLSRLPLLEVLAARAWQKHGCGCGRGRGRGHGFAQGVTGGEAEAENSAVAVIDAACSKMGKTREQLAWLAPVITSAQPHDRATATSVTLSTPSPTQPHKLSHPASIIRPPSMKKLPMEKAPGRTKSRGEKEEEGSARVTAGTAATNPSTTAPTVIRPKEEARPSSSLFSCCFGRNRKVEPKT